MNCFGKRRTLEISQNQNDITEAQLEQAALEFAQHGLPKAQVSLKSSSSMRRPSVTQIPPQYFDRPIDVNTPVMSTMPGQVKSSKTFCSIQ